MATLEPEPFGQPTLLLGSSLLSDANDTTTFTSNGLLDTGPFGGSGDDGGESASSVQSSPWTAVPDGIGSTDGDVPSGFMSNGLLDGPTQMTSTVMSPDHLYGVLVAHLRFCVPRSEIFDAPKPPREPLFRLANPGWIYPYQNVWRAVRG